jgi:hypothetical protein
MSYPALGAQLTSRIPRLETVSKIIKNQLAPPALLCEEELFSDQAVLGAQLLKFFNDYDEFVSSSADPMAAIKKMENAKYKYPVKLIRAFKKILENDLRTIITKYIEISKLKAGMVQEEDITTAEGIKLLPSQTELSANLLDILKDAAHNYNLKQSVKVSTTESIIA